jgi:16S rRNA (cytosine967-C5)-methyltransferase
MNAVTEMRSTRELAAAVVARVLREGANLDAALDAVTESLPATLVPPVRSLSFCAVRGFYRHEALLGRLLSRPVKRLDVLVRAILSVALFELEDARTPQYAVVDAAVSAAKAAGGAGGLVNAVLRRYLRERAMLDAEIAKSPAARYAAPQWLAERLRADWPLAFTEVLAASDEQAPMWLRVNPARTDAPTYVERLRAAGIEARAEPRVPNAVVLAAPCDVALLPGFGEGTVSVQDLGAQCVAFALALEPGQRVLDACAAPGGKTALIAERAPKLAQLTALDLDAGRLERVRENLTRGGLDAQVLCGDAGAPETWWDGVPYDRILLDAPCSALGVIRRHPDIRLRRSPREIARMPVLQARLLAGVFRTLARGGRLVYATCTLTHAENRDVIRTFLEDTADACILPPGDWDGWPKLGHADELGRQILPGEAGADGFYYAALTKR